MPALETNTILFSVLSGWDYLCMLHRLNFPIYCILTVQLPLPVEGEPCSGQNLGRSDDEEENEGLTHPTHPTIDSYTTVAVFRESDAGTWITRP